jgi:hypothetical protein
MMSQRLHSLPGCQATAPLLPNEVSRTGAVTGRLHRKCHAILPSATHEKLRQLGGKLYGAIPKLSFGITMLGYNEDPREIWQIEDAARYVRWWARYAGMDNEAAVLRAGQINMFAAINYGLLVACGVFGEEAKAKAIQEYKQTHGTVVAS